MRKKWTIAISVVIVLVIIAMILPLRKTEDKYGASYTFEGVIQKVEKVGENYILHVDNKDFYNSEEVIQIWISADEMRFSKDLKQKTDVHFDGVSAMDESLVGCTIRALCMGPREDLMQGRRLFAATYVGIQANSLS